MADEKKSEQTPPKTGRGATQPPETGAGTRAGEKTTPSPPGPKPPGRGPQPKG